MTNQEKFTNEEELKAETPEENGEDLKPDPFAKGRERMEAIGGFFSKAKERLASVGNQVGASISRFWSRTKSFAGESAAAVLSADELAKQGYQFTEGKVKDADKWVGQKAGEAGEYLGQKGAQAVGWAGDKIEQGFDWTQEKADQLENFVENNWDKAKEFTANKADQVKNFATEKVELAKDVAFFVKNKTAEGLNKA